MEIHRFRQQAVGLAKLINPDGGHEKEPAKSVKDFLAPFILPEDEEPEVDENGEFDLNDPAVQARIARLKLMWTSSLGVDLKGNPIKRDG